MLTLLQAFFTIRSERQLMEPLDYNLLFRWFVGLSMDERVWAVTVYSKNRDRLVAGDVAARFLQAVVQGERVRRLLSEEHFSVDGTLIEAWASMNSFRPKEGGGDDAQTGGGRNAERDFRGERLSNATHASSTDADARLYRKGRGQSSRLCFKGHLLMENGNALIVDAACTEASGTAERDAALAMVGRRRKGRRTTLVADKAYYVADFVDALRGLTVTPHIAVDGHVTKTGKRRKTRIDRRTTRHPGYAVSQRLRKRIEEDFGWIKTPVGWPRPAIAGSTGWAGCSRSPPPPTTWSGCPNSSPKRRRGARKPPNAPSASPRAGREAPTAPPITRENPPNRPQMVGSSAAC